jgi:hypothetical protein
MTTKEVERDDKAKLGKAVFKSFHTKASQMRKEVIEKKMKEEEEYQ